MNNEQLKKLQYQTQLLHEIVEKSEINVVTCGNCGSALLHRISVEEIECPDCGFKSEPCDFPDLFFETFYPEKKMTKKTFKEKCHFQHFSGGVNRRNAIYFDYKEGYGWKYKVKAHSSLINSKDLFNQFYEWIVNDELKPDYSEIRVAETDGERFKIAISG